MESTPHQERILQQFIDTDFFSYSEMCENYFEAPLKYDRWILRESTDLKKL